ncbi:site-specific integrase [Frankia sp. R82]|uniref:tyrosine-type recombinase/integrase n=1 Tax=Frankia sp. R82 TaxID=2950553 RepID=UPI002043F49D|nr:site-specific integrase [Frankia sp. R82]MCM3885645.1 site-specific integrase [Frankia sp. R82]
MGVVRALTRPSEAPTVAEAVGAFLSTLDHPETAGTRRVYASTLRQLREHLGPGSLVAVLDDPGTASTVAGWFAERWGPAAPATFNRNLDALRSAAGYWRDQGWIAGDPTRAVRRRSRAPDRSRALARAVVEELLGREDIGLRERVLWRMLYETAARASEVLALDADDLDLRNRCAKVRRKGNAVDVIVWRTGTARLLPRLLKGRAAGPVFLTDRRARLALPPGDLDPGSGRARLSYRRAAELFTAATSGATLHQLRHSALTHAAEDGANTSTLLSYSGHTSVASLARYARVSPEALARWQAGRDPARRR